MPDKDSKKQKSAAETASEKQNPNVKRAAQETTEVARKAGQKAATVEQSRGSREALLAEIGKPTNEISFSQQETALMEKALGIEVSKLDKRTLAHKIKMLNVDDIDKAENIAMGTGARLFTLLEGQNGKKEQIQLGQKFKQGDKITVHFRDNEIAEDNYGMRHLFKTQPEIRQVYIKQNSGRGKGREGLATRRSSDGNFHFFDGSYAPIFTGTEIEIKEVFTPEQLEEYKKSSNEYTVEGGTKRYIPKAEEKKYEDEYGITPPPTKTDAQKAEEYWRKIDATDYSQSDPDSEAKRSVVSEQEYIPANEREGHFIEKWREIMSTSDKQRLIDMKNEIVMLPDDPIVNVPGEIRGIRLRSGAALRYALFKRHAQLVGHNVEITSSYRSIQEQRVLWDRGLVRRMGEFRRKYPNRSAAEIERIATEENARFVARPGVSHHNTGGAADIRISGMEMSKYRGSHEKYMEALKTGNMSGLSAKDAAAVQTRIQMDNVLLASHFMGTNYFRETWHWNIDNENGKDIYRNA